MGASKRVRRTFNMAAEYSANCGGRCRKFSDYSGEEFREDYLEPWLEAGETVTLDLSGCSGFTFSFLDEVFGGVVRKYGLDKVRAQLKLTGDPRAQRWIVRIHEFMESGEIRRNADVK